MKSPTAPRAIEVEAYAWSTLAHPIGSRGDGWSGLRVAAAALATAMRILSLDIRR